MWRKPIWFYTYFSKEQLETIPTIKQFGYGQTWSTEYYNSSEVRNDPPHHLFQFTLEGYGHYHDSKGLHKITPGKGFLCNPLEPGIEYFYPDEAKETWRFLFLVFNGGDQIFEELKQKYGTIFDIKKDNLVFKKLMPITTPEMNSIISKELPIEDSTGIAMEFIRLLVKSSKKSPDLSDNSYLIRNAMQLIEDNSSKGLNVDSLAKTLSVTPEHLSRLFKSDTGFGPHHFIVKQKIQLAEHLLSSSNLRIKEIALRSGFESPRDFNRTFKKLNETTPSEFRKATR